jgi:hypothetical protein
LSSEQIVSVVAGERRSARAGQAGKAGIGAVASVATIVGVCIAGAAYFWPRDNKPTPPSDSTVHVTGPSNQSGELSGFAASAVPGGVNTAFQVDLQGFENQTVSIRYVVICPDGTLNEQPQSLDVTAAAYQRQISDTLSVPGESGNQCEVGAAVIAPDNTALGSGQANFIAE